MFIVDSHCHLDGLDYEKNHRDLDDVIAKAAARDVKFMLAIATTLPGFHTLKSLVGERKNIALSCGVHPLNQEEAYDVEEFRRLSADPQVVALGKPGWIITISQKQKISSSARSGNISIPVLR